MKNLLVPTLLFIFSFCTLAQEQNPCYSINDYQALLQESNPPISYQLVVGWNIVGYTGTADNNGIVTQLNQSLTNNATAANTFQVIKDVTGQFWSAVFSQISTFTPGEGYMMYVVSEAAPVLSFNRPVALPLIVGCTDCTALFFNPWATQDDGSCEAIVTGCMDDMYIEYNSESNVEDETCLTLIVHGCTDAFACNYNELANIEDTNCTYETETTDCDGNPIVNYAIGDLAHGGMVFYIDETGDHGLVAALEDVTEGSYMGIFGTPERFEWGCYQQSVSGADGDAIGTGYQNTLDISAQNCQTIFGGITAVQATLNYQIEGYTDWFLPSKEELQEMYNTIGNGGLQDNIGGFETSDDPYYWSSSENDNYTAWGVSFSSGATDYDDKANALRVRAVRAF
jgi:hypothetical protein